jgi:hypothetical protein
VVFAFDEAYANLACDESTWVVDTTTSFPITPYTDFFSSYTSGDFGWVRMGDIQLETGIGCKFILKDVRYVLEMRFNLIFIGKLDDEGYHNYLGGGQWKLSRDSLILARGKKINTLYKTNARLVMQRKEKTSKIKMETQKTKNRIARNWNKNCLNNQETHTRELHKERSPLRVRSCILRSRLFSYSKSKFSRYKEILK